jgi:hypothetical protein
MASHSDEEVEALLRQILNMENPSVSFKHERATKPSYFHFD